MEDSRKILGSFMLVTLLILSLVTISVGSSIINIQTSNDISPYTGHLRVYVVEPTSRWDNYDHRPYHYGFLDFAIDETLSIEYQDTYNTEITWSAQDAGYSGVSENNIIVIATVFNPESKKGYANPPFQNSFNAYYVDAAAGAKPGETGENTVNEDFTHTVFVEEATATWCPHCPEMAEALNSIYDSGDYPFYFVAMISDENDDVYDRLINDYNLYGYPSSFFDGGYKVLVGGYDQESPYRSRIESCGIRDVHEMDLSLSVEWLGDG